MQTKKNKLIAFDASTLDELEALAEEEGLSNLTAAIRYCIRQTLKNHQERKRHSPNLSIPTGKQN